MKETQSSASKVKAAPCCKQGQLPPFKGITDWDRPFFYALLSGPVRHWHRQVCSMAESSGSVADAPASCPDWLEWYAIRPERQRRLSALYLSHSCPPKPGLALCRHADDALDSEFRGARSPARSEGMPVSTCRLLERCSILSAC